MAGLAATLNVPEAIEALASALGTRGADGALCRLTGVDGARLDVCVRAVMPAVARVVGEGDEPKIIAAFAVDGVASVTALDGGYANRGPAGLLMGDDPYAVVLADAEREVLVLARNGDGPGLYYARSGDGWLVSSEPAALIAAGVPAHADHEQVVRYIETGACDDGPGTFFAGIAQLRPNEAVVLARIGEIRSEPAAIPDRRPPAVNADGDGRLGVLLSPGLAGASVLGAVLTRDDAPRPVPVHTVIFPTLKGPASHQPAVLVPLPHGMVRHTEHPLDPASLDLDGFLRDMGEPVGDLGLYCSWAVARGLDGGVDTLLDASRGGEAGVSRFTDRIQARYGVTVRFPLRAAEREGFVGDAHLMSVASRGLLPPVVKYAVQDSAGPVGAAEIVLAQRERIAAAVAQPRPWSDEAGAVEAVRRLVAGEPANAEALLRAVLVERWLSVFEVDPQPLPTPSTVGRARAHPTPADSRREADAPVEPTDVLVAGAVWSRMPVRTEVFSPGDLIALRAAWYASTALSDLTAERREALDGPWFAVLSAKALAICQRRATPLWKITPGASARALSRMARGDLHEAWTMQVAIEEGGVLRVGASTVAGALGLRGLAGRLIPDSVTSLSPPRSGAVPPADGAVIRPPFLADEAAAALRDALRYSLAPETVATLAGCAIVSADDEGSRLLGFAAGPNVTAVPDAEQVVAELCADNPAGQGDQRTPLVLLFRAPTPRVRSRTDRDPKLIDRKPTPPADQQAKVNAATGAAPRPSPRP